MAEPRTPTHPHGRAADPLVQGFGFLGGPLAWTLYFGVAYVLTEIDCRSGRLEFEVLGLPGLHALGMVAMLIATATAVAAGFAAATSHPSGLRFHGLDPADAHESEGRSRFLSVTGTVLSALFALSILTNGSSFFVLRACSA